MRGRVQHPQLFARLFRLHHRLDAFARRTTTPARRRLGTPPTRACASPPRRRLRPPRAPSRKTPRRRGTNPRAAARASRRAITPSRVADAPSPSSPISERRVPTARFPRDAHDPWRVPRRRRGSWTSARGARPRRRRANGPCPPGARRPRRRPAAPRRTPPPRAPPPNRPGCNTPAFEPTTRDRREAAAASARNEPCDDGGVRLRCAFSARAAVRRRNRRRRRIRSEPSGVRSSGSCDSGSSVCVARLYPGGFCEPGFERGGVRALLAITRLSEASRLRLEHARGAVQRGRAATLRAHRRGEVEKKSGVDGARVRRVAKRASVRHQRARRWRRSTGDDRRERQVRHRHQREFRFRPQSRLAGYSRFNLAGVVKHVGDARRHVGQR